MKHLWIIGLMIFFYQSGSLAEENHGIAPTSFHGELINFHAISNTPSNIKIDYQLGEKTEHLNCFEASGKIKIAIPYGGSTLYEISQVCIYDKLQMKISGSVKFDDDLRKYFTLNIDEVDTNTNTAKGRFSFSNEAACFLRLKF